MEKTRNVALAGHNGTGKTSMVETILSNAGIIGRLGKVQEGNTVSDYREDEIKRQMSIDSTVVSFNSGGHAINIVDTPGYADFCCDLKFAMKASDSAVIVLDASSGIEVGTETAWEFAEEFKLPRMVFLNMMEKESADFSAVLSQLDSKWGKESSIVPLQVPVGAESGFKGVVDLLGMKVLTMEGGKEASSDSIPSELSGAVEEARNKLVEAAAETDDALIEKYLGGESLTDDELSAGLRAGILGGKIVPVACGSAERNIAIGALTDIIINLLPSPDKMPGIEAAGEGKEEKILLSHSPEDPAAGYVFKTSDETHLGNVTFLRLYSGRVCPGTELYNPGKNTGEKINQIFSMRGKNREEVKEVLPGDIVAFTKLKSTRTGDTLCDKKKQVVITSPGLPEGVVSIALMPATKKDQEKLSFSLAKLAEEDPGIKVRFDSEFAQTIITGMGDVHLDIIVERLKDRFGVEVNVEKTKVPYRETIRSGAKAQGKYKKQSGGRGQYGDAWLEIEPMAEGGFEFMDKIVGGVIPSRYIPAVEKGVKESMKKGELCGYPVINVRASVVDGSFHNVDSSDIAFQIAASMAFKKAFLQANPALLEPYVEMQVAIPNEYVGDITSDLNGRRGRIMGIESAGEKKIIKAQAPLAEVERYSADLRSMTQGRGSFQMKSSHYEEVPARIMEKVISEIKKAEEEKE